MIRDKDPSVDVANVLAIWCIENGACDLTWLTKEFEQNIYTELQKLSDLPISLSPKRGYFSYKKDFIKLPLPLLPNHGRGQFYQQPFDFKNDIFKIGFGNKNIAIEFALNRNFNYKSDPSVVSTIAGKLGVHHKIGINSGKLSLVDYIARAIEKNTLQMAQQLVQAMQVDSNPSYQRLGVLLSELLACISANTSQEQRQAWRKYVVQYAEILICNKLGKRKKSHKWWLWEPFAYTRYYTEELALLSLYWWLQIVMAREEGKLPAWEGIRVVRERELL